MWGCPTYRWGVVGELPPTARGNHYVMIAVEYFTKWVELVPVKSKSTADVAHAFLDQVLSRLGTPGEVLTGQGKEFKGAFQTLLANQQVAHRLASREHPQADDLAERMVQTLRTGLRKVLLDKSKTEWDLYMPYIAMGYRMYEVLTLLSAVWEV